jgi:Ran GTPase-activating protein (RanGAP) involved in mRNA processing and transport
MVSQLDLSYNQLCGIDNDGEGQYNAEGITAIADALRVNGGLTSLNLSSNQLCGVNLSSNQLRAVRSDYRGRENGTYNAEGIIAIADALRVNGGLTKLSLARNKLEEEGTKAICEALEQNTTLKELDISGGYSRGSNIDGSAGVKHVAKMLAVNGGLTSIDLLGNHLDAESAKMLAEVAKQKGMSLCGIQHGQTTAYFCRQGLEPPDAILLASDLSQAFVTGALTELSMYGNCFGDEGARAICEAIQSNKGTKLVSLNMAGNNIGQVGAKSVAAMVAVTGALTEVDVTHNNIAGEGAAQLAAAVLGNLKIETFNEIPLKEMRANSLTELDLNGKGIGVEGGMVMAGLIPVMGALTQVPHSAPQRCLFCYSNPCLCFE